MALAAAATFGSEHVFALSGPTAGLPVSPVHVLESAGRACIDHVPFEASFGHGEFQRDGFDPAFWDTRYAWGRTNPAGADAAYYADPDSGASRTDTVDIVDDPLTGDKHVL